MNEIQQECSGPALAVGTVRGVRGFKIDHYGRLTACQYKGVWKPGENVATCKADPYAHIPLDFYKMSALTPTERTCPGIASPTCTCGFYAYHDGSKYEHGDVHGVIEGYGKTTVGRKGFRCEKATLLALTLPRLGKPSRREWARWLLVGFVALNVLVGVTDWIRNGPSWTMTVALAVDVVLIGGNGFLLFRDHRKRNAHNDRVQPLRELLARNYPGVALFDDVKSMTAEFPPDRGEPVTPETDPMFWGTRMSGLTFVAKTHKYRLDGKPVPGVTTLLGKGLPKPALTYWAAKTVAEWVADNKDGVEQLRQMGRGPMVQALKSTPWEKRDEAAVRGTDVHALAEDLIHGREVDVPEHLTGHVDAYVRWLNEWQPEVVLTECAVGSRRWWYAGTFDAIVRISGEVWLLDWKTSKAVYGDNAVQVASYANAEFYVDHEGTEQPMPMIDRLGILHIRADGADLHEVTDPAAAWKDALHIFWVAKAADRIKEYLSEPMVPATTKGAA